MRLLIIGGTGGPLFVAGRMASRQGAAVEQVDECGAALRRLRAGAHVDLILCELDQDIGGLIGSLRAERMSVAVVACATDPDPDRVLRVLAEGAREFLPLPPDADLIAAIIAAAAGEGETLVAHDPAMLATLRRAEQVAGSTASVLIAGESGTGKEVLARYLHRKSRRAGGPFVAVNCAAIPEDLLESELFGHEKGAFSGATARRIGKFEAAGGGTLLLDEISEMDVRLQAKLLRAVQEREIDRVGGDHPVKVDVRLLATTNRSLTREVAAGRFREDLFFRLNVIALTVPPLRERPADIAPLARHYVAQFSEANGLSARPLSELATLRLRAHAWPGNVRELENTIHRAVLLAEGDVIGEAAIELTTAAGAVQATSVGTGSVGALVGRTVDEVERDLILQTLNHTLGNRTHAATILGISIRALRNKLRDYAGQGLAVTPPAAGVAA